MNSKKSTETPKRTIAVNRKARHDYFIEETLEAGLVLQGWEVKSIRQGRMQIADAHIIFKHGEAWLLGTHITPLESASTHIHPIPDRTRKILLHRQQISKLIGQVERKGYTLIPLDIYWKEGRAKLTIALAHGKKSHDKRASIKERDWQREKSRLLKRG
jgi:SsrA-binding protein